MLKRRTETTLAKPNLGRRRFIRGSIVGGLLIAGYKGQEWFRFIDVSNRTVTPRVMVMWEKLADVFLDGLLPEEPTARKQAMKELLNSIQTGHTFMQDTLYGEVQWMYRLITAPATRGLTAGMWSGWDDASKEDVTSFINEWSNSDDELKIAAFRGLKEMCLGNWFGLSRSWDALQYPGPPFGHRSLST